MGEANALTKEWYTEIEAQAASNFVNLPVEFQLRGYNYNTISKSYLQFFQGDNSRQDNLQLAKKFLRFIRTINKNRAKEELGEDFFLCFEYFMDNFSQLMSKQDFIKLETLDILTSAIDKSQFVEDIISVDELKKRVVNLKKVQEEEEAIEAEWKDFDAEYQKLNAPENRQETYLLIEQTGGKDVVNS